MIQSSSRPRIGYLGLGLMGLPMVMRLLSNGYEVSVWNRSAAKCDPAIQAGATHALTPRELALNCDLLLMCLTDARAVEAVMFGQDGVAEGQTARLSAGMAPGAKKTDGPSLVLDFSSIDPNATKALAIRTKRHTGMSWLDAPVSGGKAGATAGTLTFFVGGDPEDFESVRPVLTVLGQNMTLMGPTGSGQMTKLVNQVISGCTMTIVAEAIHLAEKSGIDATQLAEALKGGFADSKPFQLLAPRMASRSFSDPPGTVAMMLKDIQTIRSVGGDNSASLPMTDAACQVMTETVDLGFGEHDISTMIETYSRNDRHE